MRYVFPIKLVEGQTCFDRDTCYFQLGICKLGGMDRTHVPPLMSTSRISRLCEFMQSTMGPSIMLEEW